MQQICSATTSSISAQLYLSTQSKGRIVTGRRRRRGGRGEVRRDGFGDAHEAAVAVADEDPPQQLRRDRGAAVALGGGGRIGWGE